MNKDAFNKISYGLYIVASAAGKKQTGCIANSFIQITDKPKQVCLVLNKKNYTTELILDSHKFNVGVLADNVSMDIIKRFGFISGRDIDKFEEIEYFKDVHNIKQIKDIICYFSCEVMKTIDVGTHYMFIAYVSEYDLFDDISVLTYEKYHERKAKKGFKCKVCGFVYEGEKLPDDYICPICKVDASYFEKI